MTNDRAPLLFEMLLDEFDKRYVLRDELPVVVDDVVADALAIQAETPNDEPAVAA